MKVDMSSAGITARLREMDELWVLSGKLMNVGRKSAAPGRRTAARALAIYDSIRQVLTDEWDPIGIANERDIGDEYDAYIAPVYRILVGTRSENDLTECLSRIERELIGTGPANAEQLIPLARRLLKLAVNLDLGTTS
ncbi:MAG: hypothetical protein AB7F88_06615 [Pyrinomonadaceae bacterium]